MLQSVMLSSNIDIDNLHYLSTSHADISGGSHATLKSQHEISSAIKQTPFLRVKCPNQQCRCTEGR